MLDDRRGKPYPFVLIVEDDPAQAEMLRFNFSLQGFGAAIAPDGEEALTLVAELHPDIVVLDLMIPKTSGFEVCRQLRRGENTRTLPIIMLTARGEEHDRIRGLETGADDYLVKPFSPNELIARIRAILRRKNPALNEKCLSYGGLIMDLESHRVRRSERSIKLGPTEFRLLQALLQRPAKVFSREELLDLVWGANVYVEIRTVDVHIRRLRKALNADGEADLIRTVRGTGYALDVDPE